MGQAVTQITGSAAEERYFLQKVKLGQGAFGTVWRAIDRQNDNVVAVKQLDKSVLPTRGVRRADIEREVSVMEAVSHDNVTKLFGHWEDSKSIFLVLEYCDGGDFGDKVKERGMELEESQAAEWMLQVLSAMRALHSKLICHRDIKPDNFMVHGNILKLSDFGLASNLPKGQLLTDKCGTPAFMSPEQHLLPKSSKGYNHSCDVWAAGVTMYMLMFGGKHPFLQNQQQLDEGSLLTGQMDFSVNTSFFSFGHSETRYSEAARFLCKRMVRPDVRRRVSAEEALKDIWFREMGVSKVRQHAAGKDIPSPPEPQQASAPLEEDTVQPPQEAGWWPFGASKLAQSEEVAEGAEAVKAAESGDQQLQGLQELSKARQHLAAKDVTADLHRHVESLEDQLRLQQEQNESQLEVLVQSNQLMRDLIQEKQKLADERATAAAGQSGASRKQTQHFGDGLTLEPLLTQALRTGLKCRYWSSTYARWLPAVVQNFNASDTSFDLDIRQHATLDNISPAIDAKAAEAWPPGTSVSYKSSTASQWLPAVIRSYNAPVMLGENGTYNLDVRECADCDRIRPRPPLGVIL